MRTYTYRFNKGMSSNQNEVKSEGVGELLKKAALAYEKEEKEYAQLKETLEVTKKCHEETKLELQNLKTWKEDIMKFLTAPHQVPFNSSVGGEMNGAGVVPVQVYRAYTPPLILTEAFPTLGKLFNSESTVKAGESLGDQIFTTAAASASTNTSQPVQVMNTIRFPGQDGVNYPVINFGNRAGELLAELCEAKQKAKSSLGYTTFRTLTKEDKK